MDNIYLNLIMMLAGVLCIVLWYRRRRARKMSQWK
jgi:hypothetical protein